MAAHWQLLSHSGSARLAQRIDAKQTLRPIACAANYIEEAMEGKR